MLTALVGGLCGENEDFEILMFDIYWLTVGFRFSPRVFVTYLGSFTSGLGNITNHRAKNAKSAYNI